MHVIVHPYNEVYNRIECDPGIAQEIIEHFTFEVPGAKYNPLVKAKKWDGKIHLMSPSKRLLYCGLYKKLYEFCEANGYSFQYEFTTDPLSLSETAQFIDSLNLPFPPRDYQIKSFVHAVRHRRSLLLSPTASGKSLIAYLLTRWYSLRTLIVVPTLGLIHQMADDFASYGYGDPIHKIYSGQEAHSSSMITVSTWQSIYNYDTSYFSNFDVIIVDECHLAKAKSLKSIMENCKHQKYRFGLTGTLDGEHVHEFVLEGLFGPEYRVTTTSKLIEEGHLSKFDIKCIVLKHPKPKVKKLEYKDEIDYIVTNEKRNKFIANLALSLPGNTLILFQYVAKHGKQLFGLLKALAPQRKIFYVSGEVDGEDRDELRKIIEKETNAIVVASNVFTTGVNIVNLHNLIFTSPTKAKIKTLQSIGRGLRKSSTQDTILYDLADDLSTDKPNHTLLHFGERIRIYNEENFNYKIYKVNLDG